MLRIVLSTYSTSTMCNIKNMLRIVLSTYSTSTMCYIKNMLRSVCTINVLYSISTIDIKINNKVI